MMPPLQPQTPCKACHEASDAWNTLFTKTEASVPISPCSPFVQQYQERTAMASEKACL